MPIDWRGAYEKHKGKAAVIRWADDLGQRRGIQPFQLGMTQSRGDDVRES